MEDVITETGADMMNFTQTMSKLRKEYAEAHENRGLRYERVYDVYILKEIFIEGLPESIRQSMRSYWGSKIRARVHELARHATSFTILQHGLRNTPAASKHDNMDNRRGNQKREGRNFNIIK